MADLGRILVTGANGQIGRALITRLTDAAGLGAEVRAVVRSERAAATLRRSCGEDLDLRILDYADGEALSRAAEGCRFAVHLVGIIKEGRSSRYEAAHQASSRALARAADAAGLSRIAYLSILGVSSDSPNACLASKGEAERLLLEAKTPAVVLRVPMVLGEGDRTSSILRGEARARLLPLPGGGRNRAQPIYVGDVVEGVLAALQRPGLEDAVLDLAGPEALPARELIERVARLHDLPGPRVLPLPLGLVKAAAWLVSRFSAEPPLTPTMLEVITLDDAVDPGPARDRLGIQLTPLDETLRRTCGPGAP